MLWYDKINSSEEIDVAKSNNGEYCMVCHYWFFDHGFKFQNFFCNGCYDLTMLCLIISDIAITTVKIIDSSCIFYDISKLEAIHLLKNYVVDDRGYM